MNQLSAKKIAIYLLFFITLPIFSFASNASIIFINEIHYDNNGADQNEFVELAGTAGLSLMDWSLVFYNGSNGQVYKTINIGDVSLNDTEMGFGFHALSVIGIQNGSSGGVGDGIALIDNNNQLQQFISYEGAFEATNGIAQGIFSDDINIIQSSTPIGMSLQLSGTGNNYQDFTWILGNRSIGSSNISQHFNQKTNTPTVQVTEPNLAILFLSIIILMFLVNRPAKRL
ncbi:MAG: hypothetical protein HRT53_03045 [Colwellia sp.]|nr:hypothetical protein [Colwellia sp.]